MVQRIVQDSELNIPSLKTLITPARISTSLKSGCNQKALFSARFSNIVCSLDNIFRQMTSASSVKYSNPGHKKQLSPRTVESFLTEWVSLLPTKLRRIQ